MTLYIDGVLQSLPPAESSDWTKTSSVSVPPGVEVIAIECIDYHVIPGILASMDNVLTDESWMCSSVHEDGWEEKNFATTSGNWAAATEIAQHGGSPWGVRTSISLSAHWIWTQHHTWPKDIDKHVYCRKALGKFHCND